MSESGDGDLVGGPKAHIAPTGDTWRAITGTALGVAAIVGMIITAMVVVGDLQKLLVGSADNTLPLKDSVYVVFIAGHAVVTVAIVWFLYQLLKASERLLLPRHYIDQVIARDPSFLRAMLGVEDPASNLKTVTASMKELAETASSIAKSVSRAEPSKEEKGRAERVE